MVILLVRIVETYMCCTKNAIRFSRSAIERAIAGGATVSRFNCSSSLESMISVEHINILPCARPGASSSNLVDPQTLGRGFESLHGEHSLFGYGNCLVVNKQTTTERGTAQNPRRVERLKGEQRGKAGNTRLLYPSYSLL